MYDALHTDGNGSITDTNHHFRMGNDWTPGSFDPEKPTEMKLTAEMLTKAGFIAVHLGDEEPALIHREAQVEPDALVLLLFHELDRDRLLPTESRRLSPLRPS